MDSILDALGRLGTVDAVVRALTDRKDCWISGPSGSGKTEFSRHVAGIWARTVGEVHCILGDKDQAASSYLAAYRALASTRANRTAREADRDFPFAVMRAIPAVGGPISALAKMLVTRLEPSGPDFLSSEAQDVLAGFQRACRGERVLFVVDNVHWLDSGTADLLLRMKTSETAECYSFIGRSVFLFVETTDQEAVPAAAASVSSLKSKIPLSFQLGLPSREQFGAVLSAFGLAHEPDREIVDRLYDVTHGHLKLAREIVQLLQEDTVDANLSAERALDVEDLARKLLELRLQTLSTGNSQIERLLGIASCIGQTFSRRELECAFELPERFAAALDLARREEFVHGDGDSLYFVHEIVQSAVHSIVKSFAGQFHEKLAECVRHIRPGDYQTRLRHSLLAENSDRSAPLCFSLLLQERRGEINLDGIRPPETTLAQYVEHFEAALSALQAMDSGRHTEAIRILVPFYEGEVGLVQGELAYLIALNYYKKRSRPDYENARTLLEPWVVRRDEGELWYRLMLTLAVVYASLGDQRGSSETLTRARIYLDRAATYDSSARAKIQTLNRKADVFYPVEVAGVLISKAVDYFAPPPDSAMPRNAFQYVAALINLSGNAYVRGEFDAGLKAADTAIRFITAYSNRIRLPEAYKAFNNYAICALRGSQLSAAATLEILDAVSKSMGESDRLDYSLLVANRGVVTMMCGRISEADALLERCYNGCKVDGVEGYYLLFSATNYAISRYLLGEPQRAIELLDEVAARMWEIPNELRRSLEIRNETLRQGIATATVTNVDEIDQLPRLMRGVDGPHVSWRSFGYGLVMSDIQVWSES
jgi:tetratricopeptide (TPR) repeat protein/energy-coupling factor transporter ATP-binding protein EcfA2